MSNKTLLGQLADDYGMTVYTMLEEATFDSVSPAICTTPGCGYTTDMEPDQWAGWCEECNAGTVKSALVLAGIL